MTAEQVSKALDLSYQEACSFLESCYSRCILNKDIKNQITWYSPTDFYTRLDHFAKYENWDEIPEADRRRIDREFLDQFISRHRSDIELKVGGLSGVNALPNDTVMLLDEIEEMLDAATLIVVQPCDCRRLGQYCDFPVETCLWFDDDAQGALDRGQGRKLTKKEAIDLVRYADKKGLMHTADSEWQTRGLNAICNCCACDCYPFRAAQELGTKGIWPKSRYIAAHDLESCTFCGTCVDRCHFDAFYHDGSLPDGEGTQNQIVLFDPEKCWGCGLCANTCPESAIIMEEIV
jgi:NAD-dependent dihydropyrimidine dehydrogenase PreA subunit